MNGPAVLEHEVVLDRGRHARIGLDEAIYAAGKSAPQLALILDRIEAEGRRALFTRLDSAKLAQLPAQRQRQLDYCSVSCTAIFGGCVPAAEPDVAIVAAGTSDVPVACEAERTLRYHGCGVTPIFDVGVAGLSRLLNRLDHIRCHAVVIAVAGMEGALPSVLGGLIAAPLIAVPTSVGYGVGSGGRVALDAMLTSCAPGIGVMNIDNGYGAACAALRVVHALRAQRAGSAAATPAPLRAASSGASS